MCLFAISTTGESADAGRNDRPWGTTTLAGSTACGAKRQIPDNRRVSRAAGRSRTMATTIDWLKAYPVQPVNVPSARPATCIDRLIGRAMAAVA